LGVDGKWVSERARINCMKMGKQVTK